MASLRRKSVATPLLAALALFALPRIGRAEEDQLAAAARLAREAEGLLGAGKTTEACDKYEASQALDPRGATLLELGLCREKEGRLGSALLAFEAAEKAAVEEKRDDRANTARAKKRALVVKVPRVSVTAKPPEAEGLEVRVGLTTAKTTTLVPRLEWAKGFPVDPGTVKLVATAPGRDAFETTFDSKAGQKKSISIPELAASKAPSADPPAAPTDAIEPGTVSVGAASGTEPPSSEEPERASPHAADRLVIDVGVFGGGLLSLITRGPLPELNGTPYVYPGPNGSEYLAICGNTTAVEGAGACDAVFDPAFAGIVGGQIFIGYALAPDLQLGARGFFSGSFPSGIQLVGGPSVSYQATDSLWIGLTALLGTTQAEANVIGARGSIPESSQADNAGEAEIGIPRTDLAGGFGDAEKVATAMGGFEVGGAIEVSYALLDLPSDDLFSGALLLSAWPTGLWSPSGGAAIALPVGLGYRFY
jgi:hypothetical protein